MWVQYFGKWYAILYQLVIKNNDNNRELIKSISDNCHKNYMLK